MSELTQRRRGFGVAPSPFNPVKLELGVILCLAPLAWLLAGKLLPSPVLQVLGLGLYASGSALWLIVRVRVLLRTMRTDGEDKV